MYDRVKERVRSRPRTWLITGVAGFIGSHLLESLLKLNQRVAGLDNFSTGHKRNLEQVRKLVGGAAWKKFRLHEGDVRNFELCRQACREVDFVLHHAAL